MSTDTTEPDDSTTRRLDPELRQLGQIIRLLDGMAEDARSRCVAFLWSRYSLHANRPGSNEAPF